MRKVFWALYGVYLLFCFTIDRIKFEILKKKMTADQIEEYSAKYVSGQAKRIIEKTGAKVNVVGLENLPEETCLFVCNHQENYDILVMLGYIPKPMGFISKKEMEKLPAVSYWMRQIHCIFMDRENPRESVKSILEGVDNLKKGYPMTIAPEGTRSKGPKLGEFKKGSMKLAIKSDVPVVPITLNNIYKMRASSSFLDIQPANVDLIISKPIYMKGLSKEEQNNLSETVRTIIQENLNNYK